MPSDATVFLGDPNNTDITQVELVDKDVTIIAALIGDPGPTGPPGTGAGMTHVQSSASSEWIINHNFGFKPSVEIFNSGGQEVEAEVHHVTNNQVRIHFVVALVGSARLI